MIRTHRHVQHSRVDSPAKLNLCLELLGKRADGFHELRTLMATIGWRDTLTCYALEGSDLKIRVLGDPRATNGVPADGSNLVVRGLETLREVTGSTRGALVELVKRVPNQAGLGGGSSNAAAALVAANRVWGLGLSAERLAGLAGRIGSDVPFFVSALSGGGSAAVATGRGEAITPIRLTGGRPVVVVKPSEGLSTAAVYAECRPADYAGSHKNNRSEATAAAILAGDSGRIAAPMTNHLQAAAERLAPWLRKTAAAFEACGCAVHQLSGSGSAYFGLTRSMSEARRVAARLRALRVGQVFATKIG